MNELVDAVRLRPRVDLAEAARILREHWGIEGELRPLPGERDRNFGVAVAGGDRYVLKVANAAETRAALAFQHAALRRLAAAGVPCQLPIPTSAGPEIVDAGTGATGAPAFTRLLSWLPGRPLASIAPDERTPALLVDLGRVMGRTVAALEGFDDPVAHRSFQWAAEESLTVIDAHAPAVTDPSRVELLGWWRARLAHLRTAFPVLRHGLIHNDANDHNVLVDDRATRVSGLLDLGDAIWSVGVNELAVAAAYAALDAPDPGAVIESVRTGFEIAWPLEPAEAAALRDLIALRLATSVSLSAHQARLDPDDPYLTVSEAPAWALLARLAEDTAA